MVQASADNIATVDEDSAPLRKTLKHLQAAPLSDEESEEEDSEKKRPNRKARRVARSKARAKAKGKGENAGDEGDDAGDDTSPRPSPEEVLRLIMTELTVSPEIAGMAHGIGRNSAYEAIHNGEIVANRVGHKLTCPTAPLRRQLGIDPPLPGETPVPPTALLRKKQEIKKSPRPQRRQR